MKDDMDYESPGPSGRAACACFLDKNENDDPLYCLVHPLPMQHYFQQHLHASTVLFIHRMPKNLRVGSRPRGVNFYTVKDDEQLISVSLYFKNGKDTYAVCLEKHN